MRELMVYCDGGFGNRFNALVSGLVLARELQLTPNVIWPVNNWCGAAFDELFDSPLQAHNRELASFMVERERYHYLIVEDRLGLATAWVSPLHLSHWDDVHAYANASVQDLFFYTALIPPFMAAEVIAQQVRELRFRAAIVEQANGFLAQQGLGQQLGDYLGVQIRKTDFGANGADDDNLFALLQQCPHKRFFVCSDDKAVEQRFSTLPNVVVFPKRAHVEKRVEGQWTTVTADHSGRLYPCNVTRSGASVQDAVVDLLVLSRSQIVKTSNSTFLNTALLLQAAAS